MRRSRCRALIRPLNAIAWELRTSWAKGLRVSLTIDADVRRIEGFVSHVSATGALCTVSGLSVPLERVLAVHRPSRLGDSSHMEGQEWAGQVPGAARRDPRQTEFDYDDGRGG